MIESEVNSYEKKMGDMRFFITLLSLFFISCLLGGIWGASGSGSFNFCGIRFTGAFFVIIYSSIWFFAFFLFFFSPLYDSDNKSVLIILLTAVAARILIFPQSPSDDLFRYLWEGKILASGLNPYLLCPDSAELRDFAIKYPFHSLINHPEIPAAYPPMVIYIFSIVSSFTESLYTLKALLLGFDCGSLFFLIAILKKRGINLRWALLYALNPLILYSFAGEGHFDSIQAFFMLGALFFYDKKKMTALFVFAGLAVQVKYIALIAFPFFINRDNYRYVPVFFLTIALPYFPFLNGGLPDLFNGILKFESEFAFNGSVNGIIRLLTGDMKLAGYICRLFFISFWVIGFVSLSDLKKVHDDSDPVPGILYSFSLLLILAPTVHIWYLSWVLPFAVIRHMSSWIILSLSAGFYYTTRSIVWYSGEWGMPVWAQLAFWLPFYSFFIFELFYILKRIPLWNDIPFRPKSLSVIIPVLNEESKIGGCIKAVMNDPAVSEVIVVDGNSTDNTGSAAEKAGALVVLHRSPVEKGGGRGGQILKGINKASGDIIAVVHSDVRIRRPLFSEIMKVMAENPGLSGGAAGSCYDTGAFKMKLIESLNAVRAVFFGISFGDQIQFFRRDKVVDKKLFPDIPLMEDVEFSLRLPLAGRRVFLFSNAQVSSRHWENGWRDNFTKVLRLLSVYMITRPFKRPDAASMYRLYYKK